VSVQFATHLCGENWTGHPIPVDTVFPPCRYTIHTKSMQDWTIGRRPASTTLPSGTGIYLVVAVTMVRGPRIELLRPLFQGGALPVSYTATLSLYNFRGGCKLCQIAGQQPILRLMFHKSWLARGVG